MRDAETKRQIRAMFGERSTAACYCRVYQNQKSCGGWNRCHFQSGGIIRWLDHARLYHKQGKYTLISEPYVLTLQDTERLTDFCNSNGLKFTIYPGLAIHYPGQTMAVAISQKETLETPV